MSFRNLLVVGDVPMPVDWSAVHSITSKEEGDTLPTGTVLRHWDFLSHVGPGFVRPKEMLELRKRGDELADGVVEALEMGFGKSRDALEVVREAMESEEVDERVREFWESVNRLPPDGVAGVDLDRVEGKKEEFRPRMEARRRGNERREPNSADGQAVFWRYAGPMFGALLHFSLAGGFTSPNLAAVLNETGYLTSESRDATHKRLLETSLFVVDALSDMSIGGRGWKSAIRVRLLHAQVRRRIRLGKGRKGTYDEQVSGVPINQADLVSVLGAFMIAPLWALRRCGISYDPYEAACYQAAWRHIGYYLGLDSDVLQSYYGSSFASAELSFSCFAFATFPSSRPANGLLTPTYKILSAVSSRPPMNSTVGYHCEYARFLLGSQLADHLAIPRGTWWDEKRVKVGVWTGWAFIGFGRWWRRGWEKERMELLRYTIELLALYGLGERRSLFKVREEHTWADKLTEEEGEDPGLVMGREVGLQVRRRWRLLIAEMVGVSILAVGSAAFGAVRACRYLLM